MTGIFAAMAGGGGASGGSGLVTLNNKTVSSIGTPTRTAGWKIDADGYVYSRLQGIYTQEYQWTADAVANYEVRASLTEGALTTGTAGSWLACSSDREWTAVESLVDSTSYAYLTIQVRSASTLIVQASCTVQLIANRTS